MKKTFALLIPFSIFCGHLRSQSCAPMPVPFHEGFQSVTANSQWPACWTATMGTLFTFVGSNGSFAGMSSGGNNYFNSPEFTLNAGYNYSVSMNFRQTTSGNLWSLVALHLVKGANQNLGIIASGNSFSTTDSLISGTFSVANSGTYHLGLQGLKAPGAPPAMSVFDDLRIGCANNMIVNSPIGICSGEAVEIYGSSAVSFTFQNSNGTFGDNPHIDYPQTDEVYTVTGLIYGNCVDTRTVAVRVDECLGVKENSLSIGLHPNPFHEKLWLETRSSSGQAHIFDGLGNCVYTCPILSPLTEMSLSGLQPGLYILRVLDGSNQRTAKLICR